MIKERELEHLVRTELRSIMPNMIWRDDNGDYEVFGRYRLCPNAQGFMVFCSATEVGTFSSTKAALSWCIADKNSAFNTARELLTLDNKLSTITHDISVRASIGDRSKNVDLRETILTKLESKIIHKKKLENQLANCVNWAKYVQQRGFDNETQRIGRNQPNKTSR